MSAHLFVFLGLVTAALLGPTYSDDQWIIEISRQLPELGGKNNQYPGVSSWSPMGTLHILFIWLFDSAGLGFLGVRFGVVTFFLLPSWFFLIATLRNLSEAKASTTGLWASSIFFVMFSYGWLVTIRPEPFIVFFLSSGLFFWTRAVRTQKTVFSTLALGSAAVAASTHPAGLVALGLTLAVVIHTIQLLRARTITFQEAIFTFLWPSALFLLLMFWLNDWGSMSAAVTTMAGLDTHSFTALDEWQRWERVMQATGPRAAVAVLAVSLWLFASATLFRTRRAALWALPFTLLPFGLLLTPSKWEWHVGVLLPVGVWAIDRAVSGWSENRFVFFFASSPAVVITILPLLGLVGNQGFPVPGFALVFLVTFAIVTFLVWSFRVSVPPWVVMGVLLASAAPQVASVAPDWNSSPCRELEKTVLYVPKSGEVNFFGGEESENLDNSQAAEIYGGSGYTALWFKGIRPESLRLQSQGGAVVSPFIWSTDPLQDPSVREDLNLWQSAVWDFAAFQPQHWTVYSTDEPLHAEALLGYGSVEPTLASDALQGRAVSFGMYEATRYHCFDGLSSESGLVQWPDYLINDRALFDFAGAFRGMDAVAVSIAANHYGNFYAVVRPQMASVSVEIRER